MKKFLVILLMMSILTLSLVNAQASLSADLLKYEPIPAQPGQYVTAYIELSNLADVDASKAIIELDNNFPFTVVGDNSIVVGRLKSQRSSIIEFNIKVDSQAAIGINPLKVRFSPDGVNNWQERSLDIEVKSNDISLTIIDVSTSPDEFSPGGDGIVSITLKNTENVVVRNIAVQLGLVTMSQSTVVDLPFIPTSSATEQRISRLNPNEVSTITFPIKAYPSASPGFYKLPLSISFYDDQGSKTEKQDLVGLVVKSVPELMVYLEKNTISQAGQTGDVTLKFVNKGVNDLKFLDVSLQESDSYNILSNTQEYIGDLDSDDYRSETFTIVPDSKDLDLNVLVSYKDENNIEFSESIIVPFSVVKNMDDGNKSPSFSTILLIIILLLVLVFWIRRKRRAKKHHK